MRDAAVRLFNQAQVMLRDCMGLQAGEELLILRDGTVSEDLVEASIFAAKALGANPLVMSFTPATYRPMKESEAWPLGDPIERLKNHLIVKNLWSEERHTQAVAEIEAHAGEVAQTWPMRDGGRAVVARGEDDCPRSDFAR